MERLVISGATGYIGKNLLAELVKRYMVFAIVRPKSDLTVIKKYLPQEQILFLDDYTRKFYKKLQQVKPLFFVHLAGKFAAGHSDENLEELLECNLTMPVKMLDAVCAAGCKYIVNTGSYWQNYNRELYNPVNLYAATKEAFQNVMKYYTESMGCRCITLKLFDTYGPGDNRKKVLNLIRDMKDGDSLDMTSCEQRVYYCYIQDVVNAYIAALELIRTKEPGTVEEYAVRDVEAVPLKDVVLMLKEILGKRIQLNFDPNKGRPREIMNPEGIGTRLPQWECKVKLREGLQKLIIVQGDSK